MIIYYFDSSALLKVYIEEQGSEFVTSLVRNNIEDARISILDVTLLELRSAVRRREREGNVSEREADRIIDQIHEDGALVYMVQSLNVSVVREAERILDTHPLRALDALQLAGCLIIGRSMSEPLTFVSADTRLINAAVLEGLSTLNPLDEN